MKFFFGFELHCTLLLIVKYVITVSVKQLTAELNSRYCSPVIKTDLTPPDKRGSLNPDGEGSMRPLATITKYDPPPPPTPSGPKKVVRKRKVRDESHLTEVYPLWGGEVRCILATGLQVLLLLLDGKLRGNYPFTFIYVKDFLTILQSL